MACLVVSLLSVIQGNLQILEWGRTLRRALITRLHLIISEDLQVCQSVTKNISGILGRRRILEWVNIRLVPITNLLSIISEDHPACHLIMKIWEILNQKKDFGMSSRSDRYFSDSLYMAIPWVNLARIPKLKLINNFKVQPNQYFKSEAIQLS